MNKYQKKIFKLRYKVQRFVWKQLPWISHKQPKLSQYIAPRLELDLDTRFRPFDIKVASYFERMYLAHRFDLLGSGWICRVRSRETAWNSEHTNPEVKAKLRALITPEYQPIDWLAEPSSGTRWSADEWGWQVMAQERPGQDIKNLWELARCYHLPRIAILAMQNPEKRTAYFSEFQNQVCDFLLANPFRRGANWAIAMEAAIRAINWLLAYDIMVQLDTNGVISDEFRNLFAQSIYEHGLFIYDNLEFTGNHYLSDLAGLLFIGTYLGGRGKAGKWMRFAYAEFIDQIDRQFYPDGSNYEASTCYHRLSTEIVLYTAALILGLDEKVKQKLPDNGEIPAAIWDKNFRACRFTADISRESGNVPQFGDNDNGRLVMLSPCGAFITNRDAEAMYLNLSGYLEQVAGYDDADGLYWDENFIDHTTLLAEAAGLFDDTRFEKAAENYPLEKMMITALARTNRPDVEPLEEVPFHQTWVENLPKFKFTRKRQYFPVQKEERSLRANLRQVSYPDSGIYLMKSDRVYLAVCAMPNGQNGNGGHSHNDKLSFELSIDGVDFALDPGTFCYSSSPEKRNLFRNDLVHNVIHTEHFAQNSFTGLFSNDNSSSCRLIKCDQSQLVLEVRYQDVIQYREFNICDTYVEVVDHSNVPIVEAEPLEYYSNGYGKLLKK